MTEALETKQQSPKLVFPSEYSFDRPETFFENTHLEERFSASFRVLSAAGIWIDVGNHAAIEDGFAVGPTIVGAIETDDGALKIQPAAWAMHITSGRASRRIGDSLRLPGADTNGAITLHCRSQRATTLSPLTFLCPLYPMLSPPFLAAVVVPSP
jgi:hypothetical protein